MCSKQFVLLGNRLTLLRRENPQAASHGQRRYQSGYRVDRRAGD
jgi:hypothetical protein